VQATEVLSAFLCAAAAVKAAVTAEVQQVTGLPGPWFESLLWISRAPEGASRMCDVAAKVDVPPSSFTRLVDRIEADGLVERALDPGNRRTTLLRLTPVGEGRLAEAMAIHGPSVASHFGDLLGVDELRSLESISKTLLAAVPGSLGAAAGGARDDVN
jgi:DNA-binding MarR family transcriptional regulator